MRRMLITPASPFSPDRPRPKRPHPWYTRFSRAFPGRAVGCSILPSRLEIHVVVRRWGERCGGHTPARHAARQVDEAVDAEFGLHVLFQQVAVVFLVRRPRDRLVPASDTLLVAQRQLVRDL